MPYLVSRRWLSIFAAKMRTKAEIAALEAANGTGNDHVPESAHSFLTESQRAALDAALAAKQTAPGQLVDIFLALISTVDTAGSQLHLYACQSPDSTPPHHQRSSKHRQLPRCVVGCSRHESCYVGCSSSSHCHQVTLCNQGTL